MSQETNIEPGWDEDTLFLQFNGTPIPAKDITQDTILMGDDNTPRTIIPFSIKKYKDSCMAYIIPKHESFQPFHVSGTQTLSFVSNYGPFIRDRTQEGGNFMVQQWTWDPIKSKFFPASKGTFKTKELALERKEQLDSSPQFIELTPLDYLHQRKKAQEGLRLYRPPEVSIHNSTQTGRLKSLIEEFTEKQADNKLVCLTSWLLGMWITDGAKDCACIFQSPKQGENGSVSHEEIIDAMKEWGDLVGTPMKSGTNPGKISTNGNPNYDYNFLRVSGAGNTSRTTKDPDTQRNNLLLFLLRKLEFGIKEKEKRFPIEWLLYESVEIRKAFIAGYIDGDGYLKESNCYEISAKQKELLEGLNHIARSLGLRPGLLTKRDIKLGDKLFDSHRTHISGKIHELTDIKLAYKRVKTPTKDNRSSDIKIESSSKNSLVYFEVDQNKRFLLSDYTVVCC